MKKFLNIQQFLFSKEFIKNIFNASFYFGNSIIQAITGIVAAPIFARNLLPEDFAIIGYFTAIVGFTNPLIHLSMGNYYTIKYFKNTEEENKQLLWTILLFLIGWNIILLPTLFLALNLIFHIIDHSYTAYPFLLIVYGSAFFNISLLFAQINYRVKKKAIQYFILSSALTILNVLISILFVVRYQMGATGKLGGNFVADIIIGIVAFVVIRKYCSPKFKWQYVREGIQIVSPLILGTLIIFSIRNIDKILLERLNNSYEFGYYSIGYNNAQYLVILGTALYAAFEPDVIKYTINRNKRKLTLYLAGVTLILITITVIYLIFSKYITHYLTSGRYTRAYMYANIIAVAGFFFSLSKLLLTILLALKKTKNILLINSISALLAIIIYKLSIMKYGFYGAAYGRIIIGFTICLLIVIFILLSTRKKQQILDNTDEKGVL